MTGEGVRMTGTLAGRATFAVVATLGSVALALVPASAARAARSFRLDRGDSPNVAVSENGRAHVVYNQYLDPKSGKLAHCDVRDRPNSCTTITTATLEGSTSTAPAIAVSGSNLALLTGRCCWSGPDRSFRLLSTNGGLKLSAPEHVGSYQPQGSFYPGEGLLTWYVVAGSTLSHTGLYGLDTSAFQFAEARARDPQVVRIASGRRLVTWTDLDSGRVFWRRIDAGLDYTRPYFWSQPQLLGRGTGGRLVAARNTAFLLLQEGNPPNLYVRRYTGNAWGKKVRLESVTTGSGAYEADLFADPRGRLHAVWRRNHSPDDQIRYSRSTDENGRVWTKPRTLATLPGTVLRGGFAKEFRLAVSSSGKGLVVFQVTQGSDATSTIRAVRIP
jgi:hypothetical protein